LHIPINAEFGFPRKIQISFGSGIASPFVSISFRDSLLLVSGPVFPHQQRAQGPDVAIAISIKKQQISLVVSTTDKAGFFRQRVYSVVDEKSIKSNRQNRKDIYAGHEMKMRRM